MLPISVQALQAGLMADIKRGEAPIESGRLLCVALIAARAENQSFSALKNISIAWPTANANELIWSGSDSFFSSTGLVR